MQSVQELEDNLVTYRTQLEQVNQLLEAEPENEEFKEMASGLVEVIELTQDLLMSAHEQEQGPYQDEPQATASATSFPAGPPAPSGSPFPPSVPAAAHAALDAPSAPAPALPSGLRLEAGAPVEALWTGDNQWRMGVVDSVTRGGYWVRFGTDVGNGKQLHEVRETRVRRTGEDDEEVKQRAREALAAVEREAEATRVALKRKLQEASQKELAPVQIPAKLKIKPEDPEDVRVEKKRKIHAIKSRQRLQNLELIQDKKQCAWQQFQSKGRQKKAGFFTGAKRESIFKSPDDVSGKVGVVGSGKGMTEFQGKEKHTNLKNGDEEEEE